MGIYEYYIGEYSYADAIEDDVGACIDESSEELKGLYGEELHTMIFHCCFISDDVTGNMCGSYCRDAIMAKINVICGGMDYIRNMLIEGELTDEELSTAIKNNDYELLDVKIRCYLLPGIVQKVYEEKYCK